MSIQEGYDPDMNTTLTRRNLLYASVTLAALRAPAGAAAEPCLDRLLGRRRMVRRFKDAPVDEATVDRLLAAAARAPSAGNTQPWAFVVVRAAETRADLARAALRQEFVAAAPVVIVACADLSRSRTRYGQRGDRYGVIDAAFASLLLMLAVVEEGLGACFVGAFDDAKVARVLGLPEHVLPVALIPVGQPAETPGPRARRPLATVVHRERWGK
jgi:nitroreductase